MSYGFKLLMLLSAPFPLRHSAAIRLARHPRLPFEALSSAVASHGRILSVAPSSKRGFSVRAPEVAKEGFCDTVTSNPRFKDSYSWPEWSKLTNHLLAKSHSQGSVTPIDDDDSFSAGYNLSEEFLSAAGACLNFAREKPDILRLLTKKYIKTVVENEFPYLFKNAEKSVSRMRLFLGENGSIPLESEKAQTVDIMRYLLSYMYKPFSTSNGNQVESDESVETSIRKLLLELFNVSGTIWGSKLAEPAATEAPFPNEPLSRPRGHSVEMKRGDWICQKCTYMNFARNMSCLECGNARPKLLRTGAEWECPQCDFFNYGRNNSCLRCDCKRPGDSLPPPDPADPAGDRGSVRLGSDTTSDSISRSLDRILGRSSTSSQNQPTSGDDHFRSSQFGQKAAKPRGNPDVAPFVPLPPDMFRKTPESNNGGRQLSDRGTAADFIDSLLKGSEGSMKANESSDASISNAASGQEHVGAAPENDFPDIMPMRKGENRFVVSKKKDRSLTSPAYKRRLAMEQANSYNAVPFVPFPPDYFAKKDNPPPASSIEANQPSAKAEALPDQGSNRNNFNSSGDSNPGVNPSQSEVESAGYGSFDSPNASSASYTAGSTRPSYGGFNRTSFAGPTENPSQPSSRSQSNESGGYNASVGSPAPPQSHQNTRNSVNYSYSGKSLEGSCVKEPDPLDMSEEAKAERWFRRAAQIKDISELSQIPDEDFPEIMPLRKGVNRFVVSKRKTPLERRLTSPQYRKNLPVVSSELEDSGD